MNKPNSSTRVTAPKVSMPAGGGALRGISEPFKADSFTGSGGFSIPFLLPEARGFAPTINLSYGSGSGNGLFGLGFSVSLDSIVRKTSNEIPRYDDTDIVILGSAGELLPKYTETEQGWIKAEYSYKAENIAWNVVAYRPRIEGTFALIERWTNTATQLCYWKVVTPDNITSLYGISDSGRIYNPIDPRQIFEWLIEMSYDPHGNKIIYNYKSGDKINIPDTIYNKNRDFTSQRYPDTIQYGNYFIEEDNIRREYFAFEVIFDYGQLDRNDPDAPPGEWIARPDPFSSYKSGFELRTARLCHGIYLRHHFTEERDGMPFTTAALLPEYETTSISGISIVRRIVHRGYRGQSGQPSWTADIPATELGYQEFKPIASTWQLLEADAPGYLDSSGFVPVDLDGNGIDGLLYGTDAFTGYLEPLGNGKYAPMRLLHQFPVFRDLQSGQVSLASLDGNKVLDLVVSDGITNGFFERTEQMDWESFQSFKSFPQEYLSADKEIADLSGTGRGDLLFIEDSQLKYYPSEGKAGYGKASYSWTPDCFPVTTQHGAEELAGFSDFLGDGLSHRFCLRNGCLTVWPCLGHGRFGEPLGLSNAPVIDGLFDAARVFLIDADGSGATDIVYCYPEYARIWFNQNGNSFSAPVEVAFPAAYSAITAITAGDVGGYGTTSLIFTVADPEVKHLYYDFNNKRKPYLLQSVDNGMGGLSSLTYTTSVLEQLRDKQDGRIWPTQLPVAVSVVSESRTTDQITGAVYTERFRYHDGYFDPLERRFRGFGFVETWDCETYEQFQRSATDNEEATALLERNLWMPPVYTRSWFITGAYEQTPAICAQYETEFYQGDGKQWRIPFFELDTAWDRLDPLSVRQAYASLAGRAIRTEVYAADNSSLAENPYRISMSTVRVCLVQPRLGRRFCSAMPVEVNQLNYTYDRNPEDPRIGQNLVLSVDEYGHPLFHAVISFPRREVGGSVLYEEQRHLRVLVSESAYINHINNDMEDPGTCWQYLGVGWQARDYEMGNITASTDGPFLQADLLEQVQTALQQRLGPADTPSGDPWSRLLGWSRQVFWDSDGGVALPYGEINALALLHHAETAMLDPNEVTHSFGDKVDNDLITNRCGYVFVDGYWWNYGQMQRYNWDRSQFYMPSETKATITGLLAEAVLDENGFNGCITVQYDRYWMLIVKTSSALTTTLSLDEYYEYDYQTVSPVRSIDVNGNVSEVLCDPLGQVIATTVYGQLSGADSGDLPMDQYVIQRGATFDEVIAHPATYLQGATSYFYYDLFAWKDRRQPVNAASITRTMHVHELEAAGTAFEIQMPISIAYSDGLGNMLQSKAKTTPGEVALCMVDGLVVNPPADGSQEERWLVSGHTVYNNKGLPVEQYESYFSATPHLENQQQIIDEKLVPPPQVIHYDPLGRVVRTDSPKGFFSKTVYTPWETSSYDFNDTMPDSPYYQWFMANYPLQPEAWQQEELFALQAALPCYNTPSTVVSDNLGNPIRTIACNLGAIGEDAIPEKVTGSMTPQETWAALLEFGYLSRENPGDAVAWITSAFQPYQSDFHETFLQQFPQNGEVLEDYLAQGCMTSLDVYDILGQQLCHTDPRLFLKMVREETFLFNFRNEYGLGRQVLQSESGDSGLRWSLANMAGNIIALWDSRGFQAENKYDNLQRPSGIYVSGGDQQDILASWVQLTVYGETVPNAADYNLLGKPYRNYDESGLSVMEIYNLAGVPLQGRSYLRPDYKKESNWTEQAQQDILTESGYTRSSIFNVQGQIIVETLPDGSQQAYTYDINGLMCGSKQKIANETSGETEPWKTVISDIDYDAQGKRTRVAYGNGVISYYTYDACTQQLLRSFSTRSGNDSSDENSVLHDLYYTYDPLGHTISTVDKNAAVVFHKNQKIDPSNRYMYDPLYRILRASGPTLPGLNIQERNGAVNTSTTFPETPDAADLQQLENYAQQFIYDFGNNLVQKRHMAASGNWTQKMTVADTNNRLGFIDDGNSSGSSTPFQYDGNGNMLTLRPRNTAKVNWNYLNQISSVVTIVREVQDPETGETCSLNDAEYYQYNSSGNRVRKVTERVVNGGVQIEYTEKIFLGNYQQLCTWTVAAGSASSPPEKVQSEKHTLILKDGDAPALITHRWVIVPTAQTHTSAGDIQYRYQLCDPLDSVTMELNEHAELLTFEQYYVYGGTAFVLARSQLEADSKELRFCGKERDAPTGLYYYGARYYACWLSRWMSPDPAGPVDGPNLYEYVLSNPVKYNDPTGMIPQTRSRSKNNPEPAPVAVAAPVAAAVQATDEQSSLGKRTREDQSGQPAKRAKVSDNYPVVEIPAREKGSLLGDRFDKPYKQLRKGDGINIKSGDNQVTARHNRGAPYIYGDGLPNDYHRIFIGLKGQQEEHEVAEILDIGDLSLLKTDLQRKYAFKLEAIVGLAERRRKEGAPKIFRALLRAMAKRLLKFSDAAEAFQYIEKADSGRLQASLFSALKKNEDPDLANGLPPKQKIVYDNLSDTEGGYDSDDDEEVQKEKELKKDRHFIKEVKRIIKKYAKLIEASKKNKQNT